MLPAFGGTISLSRNGAKSLIVFFVFCIIKNAKSIHCDKNGTICVDRQNYQNCLTINGQYLLIGNPTSCPLGQICDDSSGLVVCRNRTLQTRAETSISEPTCTGTGKYPAPSCYQYYECVAVMWYFDPVLRTCPDSQAYDVTLSECTAVTSVNCEERTTTGSLSSSTSLSPKTTTAVPSASSSYEIPTCTGAGKYPAQNCYQYYNCIAVMWWWEPQLLICVEGYAFDIYVKECLVVSVVDCQDRLTTNGASTSTTSTSTTKTTTTTTAASVPTVPSLPTCSGPGRFPAESCYQYYDCQQILWWWEPKLLVCVEGCAFDIYVKECILIAQVDCQQRLTTTVSSTTTTTTALTTTTVPSCSGPGRFPAESCYQYYDCQQVLWWWEPKLLVCVEGCAFDIQVKECLLIAEVDCQQRLTTTVSTTTTTTTTLTPIIVPSCSGPGRFPAESCYQYYDCQQVVWWWEPRLLVCIEGYAFDIYVKECLLIAQVDCQQRTTTTVSTTTVTTSTPLPPITVPSCSGAGRFPASSCYQYYECIPNLWWWEPKLMACQEGLAFDIYFGECIIITVVDCQQRETTTISTLKTTTTTLAPLPPVTPPACSGPGKYPSDNCHQYYDCQQVLWWWEPKLLVCKEGFAFDLYVKECLIISVVDCQQRLTTTTSTDKPTMTTVVISLPPIPPQVCYGALKYPTENCYEYYECIQVWWWWESRRKQCSRGFAFDIYTRSCRVVSYVDCQHRWAGQRPTNKPSTTIIPFPPIEIPTCEGPGRYPAESCYHYYECQNVLWWWESKLLVCQEGLAFDIYFKKCLLISVVDCSHRLTTTITTPKTTITTLAPVSPVSPPTCTGPGKYPAESCYEYYNCQQVFWWWEPKLLICEEGCGFDIDIKECILISEVDCQQRLTVKPPKPPTLAPPAIIEVPTCRRHSKHPARVCYQYWECVAVWWWFEPRLKSCSPGHAFDILLDTCYPRHQVDCRDRVTTELTPPTRPPTSPLPPGIIVIPTCRGLGRYPATNCNQYYECQNVLWWFEPKLLTCQEGLAFDVYTKKCLLISFVNCHNRLTTTLSTHRPTTTTGTTTLIPLPPITPPTCAGPGLHPAQNCHEYYSCQQNFWWWEPVLLVCEEGLAYDIYFKRCLSISKVDCQGRTTVKPPKPITTLAPPPIIEIPICRKLGKHPAQVCYQYWECVAVWWWFEPKLKSCPPDHAFDVLLGLCYPKHQVNCYHRITTTIKPPTRPPPPPLPPALVPTCHGPSKHRAPLCYQYYECQANFWWYEPVLKTCPDGDGYDDRKKSCVCAELIDCRLPIKEPKCDGYGNHPAEKCKQYYECVQSWWWWTPQLKDCPKGYGFDTLSRRCKKGFNCKRPK